MEYITDADYMHRNRVCKDFKIKKSGEYICKFKVIHYLLNDVFNNFWNMHLQINGFDPAHVLSAPGLAEQAALKNSKV